MRSLCLLTLVPTAFAFVAARTAVVRTSDAVDRHPMMAQRVLASLPFAEARAMARAMGMSSREEWEEYSCPGAYRLPSDPDKVWAAEFKGWDDWLGVMLPFGEARAVVRSLRLVSQQEYTQFMAEGADLERAEPGSWKGDHALRIRRVESGIDAGRLPARPDLLYREDWAGWPDWLGAE
eukprot:2300496-Prymnesium_polylepis.1